eukprot:TRINITY_DN40761_c0_g2_i1.p2 TRINITY_DN40761_c0_g2~~TRINITY_DN40761_c0_g2_i1.p2  ORF type:complete len:162 (-),score=23.48 TRINITY_DN40761_c0_g2_i1:177-662(-)
MLVNRGYIVFQSFKQTVGRPSRYQYIQIMNKRGETAEEKAARKAAAKLQKAEKRAKKQGLGDPRIGQKDCDLCHKGRDLLIRCQIDETQKWHMVCGRCWRKVSGGVVDGDSAHPHYRYGGLWKNLHKQDKGGQSTAVQTNSILQQIQDDSEQIQNEGDMSQ